MTRFLSALIAVAVLGATGCYATVRVPDVHASPGHHGGDDGRGNQGKNGHANSGHGGDKDHD